ncbi:MAG: hypothetical protein GX956_06445 [Firmicutes bacterium]|nr:hypothetical protein [Bacillota bacterium]
MGTISTGNSVFRADELKGWERKYGVVPEPRGAYYFLDILPNHNYKLMFLLPRRLVEGLPININFTLGLDETLTAYPEKVKPVEQLNVQHVNLPVEIISNQLDVKETQTFLDAHGNLIVIVVMQNNRDKPVQNGIVRFEYLTEDGVTLRSSYGGHIGYSGPIYPGEMYAEYASFETRSVGTNVVSLTQLV